MSWSSSLLRIFPTGVGVFLYGPDQPALVAHLPHRRGGVSMTRVPAEEMMQSSPQAWGCFRQSINPVNRQRIFPTGVGVFPRTGGRQLRDVHLPHRRGGVSLGMSAGELSAWIFPTGVGVFPCRWRRCSSHRNLPHRRGGVSTPFIPLLRARVSSPQAWGCFRRRLFRSGRRVIFPTGVGVFLGRIMARELRRDLPHRRGGVSAHHLAISCLWQSSPQAWGCFRIDHTGTSGIRIFPTGVGVFLPHHREQIRQRNLPHRRGGVSAQPLDTWHLAQSSPQAWGCFRLISTPHQVIQIFPTGVGVFPAVSSMCARPMHLPHRRGGVSHSL